ncbi:uncharacterized protein LOC116653836 [Coturnix japonica]|uniref:uncharacterized protein LOC116653836 n=1 Tax=Coturnix japonica TaxID=93934 RepID=UPI0013A5F1E3|nr:uncharacterized protein LOC116653836 [Coturnix japonica]
MAGFPSHCMINTDTAGQPRGRPLCPRPAPSAAPAAHPALPRCVPPVPPAPPPPRHRPLLCRRRARGGAALPLTPVCAGDGGAEPLRVPVAIAGGGTEDAACWVPVLRVPHSPAEHLDISTEDQISCSNAASYTLGSLRKQRHFQGMQLFVAISKSYRIPVFEWPFLLLLHHRLTKEKKANMFVTAACDSDQYSGQEVLQG